MSTVNLGAIPNAYLPEPTPAQAGGGDGLNFGAVLKNAVSSVDHVSASANAQVNNLLQGGTGDMTGVMVAVEKAFSVRFRVGEVETAKNIGEFADLILKRTQER